MKARTLLDSFHFAAQGLKYVLSTQRNMRVHFAVAFAILMLAVRLQLARLEFALLFFAIALVLALEIINTAVEALVDIAAPGYHPLAEVAKNVAAAAVLVSAANAVALGYILFGPQIVRFLRGSVQRSASLPLESLVAGAASLILGTLFLQFVGERVSPWFRVSPDLHSAVIAFLLVIIIDLSPGVPVTAAALLVAGVAVESRLEARPGSIANILLALALGGAFGLLVAHL